MSFASREKIPYFQLFFPAASQKWNNWICSLELSRVVSILFNAWKFHKGLFWTGHDSSPDRASPNFLASRPPTQHCSSADIARQALFSRNIFRCYHSFCFLFWCEKSERSDLRKNCPVCLWILSDFFKYSGRTGNVSEGHPIVDIFKCSHHVRIVGPPQTHFGMCESRGHLTFWQLKAPGDLLCICDSHVVWGLTSFCDLKSICNYQ